MVTNSVNDCGLNIPRERPLASNAPLWASFTNWLLSINNIITPECPLSRKFNLCSEE